MSVCNEQLIVKWKRISTNYLSDRHYIFTRDLFKHSIPVALVEDMWSIEIDYIGSTTIINNDNRT